MKIIIYILLILVTIVCKAQTYSTPTVAQFKTLNPNIITAEGTNVNPVINTSPLICGGLNTFWGIEPTSNQIFEFDLTNNIITYTGNSINNYPSSCGSLAICNNLNGGSYSPTLYTSSNYSAYYWSGGTNWTQCAPYSSVIILGNAGGNNNTLYYFDNNMPNDIIKYNGITYSNMHFSFNKYCGVSDIAVDVSGNAYMVSLTFGFISDSLFILSPSGQIINRFPFSYSMNNAYGCFLLNNVFYIGLGPNNPISPNTLLPITILSSNTIIGTPIPFPIGFNLNYSDLASCNPGSPLSTNPISEKEPLSISPNPSNSIINISDEQNQFQNSIIDLKNYFGQTVMAIPFSKQIDISSLESGIYFLTFQNKTIKKTAKIIKQ